MGFLDWLNFWSDEDKKARKSGGGNAKGLTVDMAQASTEMDSDGEARKFSKTASRAMNPGVAAAAERALEANRNPSTRGSWRPAPTPGGGMSRRGVPTEEEREYVEDTGPSVAQQALSGALDWAGEKAGAGLEWADENVFEPVRRAGTTLSLLPGEGFRRAAAGEEFDPLAQLGDAWDRSNSVSFGQSQWMNLEIGAKLVPWALGEETDLSVVTEDGYEELLEERKDDWYFNVTTGITDAVYSVVADPTIVGGKATTAIRGATKLRGIKAGEDIAGQVESESGAIGKRVKTLWSDDTKGWNAQDFMLGSEGVRNSSNPAVHAAALAEANKIQDATERVAMMKLVERVALGDSTAMPELAKRRALIADALESAGRITDDGIERYKQDVLAVDPSGTVAPVKFDELPAVAQLQSQRAAVAKSSLVQQLDEVSEYLTYQAEDLFGHAATQIPKVSRRGQARVADSHGQVGKTFTYRNSLWNMPVAVTQIAGKPLEALQRMRANGFVDYHAADSHKEIDAFLHGVNAFGPEQRSTYLSDYMGALTEGDKAGVVARIEEHAMNATARKYGVSPKTAKDLHKMFLEQKNKTWGKLKNRMYSAAEDPANPGTTVDDMSTLLVEDDIVHDFRGPLGPDTLANIEPMVDIREFDRVVGRHANRIKAAEKFDEELALAKDALAGEWTKDIIGQFVSIWKTASLMRLGYPARNVIESNLRTWAKAHGAATSLWMEGGRNVVTNLIKRGGAPGQEAARLMEADVNLLDTLADRIDILMDAPPNARTGGVRVEDLIAQHDEIEERLGRLRKAKPSDVLKEYGIDPSDVARKNRSLMSEPMRMPDGTLMEGAGAGPHGELFRQLASTKGLAGRQIAQGGSDATYLKSEMGRQTRRLEGYSKARDEQNWANAKSYSVSDGDVYREAWLHAVNNQIGNNPIAMRLLKGDAPEVVERWLKGSDEGRKLIRRMPKGYRNPDGITELVRRNAVHADSYVPGPLRDKFIQRKLTGADLDEYFKAGGKAPVVHGADLTSGGLGAGARTAGRALGRVLEAIATAPENKLARHPYYVMMHRQRAREMAEQIIADPNRVKTGKSLDRLDAEDIQRIRRTAHSYALKSLKETLYDASYRSNAAHALRFVSPFFAAHQDSLTRWWNLTKENPDMVGYVNQISQAPASAGVLVDEDGNIVKDRRAEQTDRLLFALPGWLGGEITEKDYKDGLFTVFGSQMSLPINTLNVIMPGEPWWSPGVGPLVSVPLSELRKAKPDLEGLVGWLDPYGPYEGGVDGLVKTLAPAHVRRLISAIEGVDDQSYGRTLNYLHQQDVSQWVADGAVGERPTIEDAKKKATALSYLRVINNATNPFPIQFASKHQFAIDAHRRLTERQYSEGKPDGWADEQFMKNYPEALLLLAEGTTTNNAGLAPTAEAMAGLAKYRKLVDDNPGLIRSIVGREGQGGEFNPAAWAAQLETDIGGAKMRDRDSIKGDIEQGLVDQGFREYGKAVDLLQAEAEDRGLNSYRDDPELMILKGEVEKQITEKYPEWGKKFGTFKTDLHFESELAGVRQVVNDKRWKGMPERTDIKMVRSYLEVREMFQKELKLRAESGGAKTMEAQTNADLAIIYRYIVDQMVAQDTQFASNWFHGGAWLESDPMLVDIKTEETEDGE